jgi:hypothetical protein
MPDTWSLITGIAGLFSFLLAVTERFANFKKYTIPLTFTLGGFAIGRLSFWGSTNSSTQGGNYAVLMIIIATLLILTAITYIFIKVGQDVFAYMVFMIGIMTLPSKLVATYNDSINKLTYNDYIQLSIVKLTNKNYDSAIELLEIAKRKTDKDIVKTEIETKIESIYKESAKLN